ncbi:THO complex subunit 7 [Dissophora globulifera]|nr:THO complex subunit 7 [Dissophora globulifera]
MGVNPFNCLTPRHFQVGLSRSKLISEMAGRERILYAKDQQNIEANIQTAEQELQVLAVKLEEAKRERSNKIQYDRIATELLQYPSRESSQQSIANLKAEILELENEADQQSMVMELRKKQFFTALMCLQSIQESIEEDQREEATRLFHKRPTHDDDDDDEDDTAINNRDIDDNNQMSNTVAPPNETREEQEEGTIPESMEDIALSVSRPSSTVPVIVNGSPSTRQQQTFPSQSRPMTPSFSASQQGGLSVESKNQRPTSPAPSGVNTPLGEGEDDEEGSVYAVNLLEYSHSTGSLLNTTPPGRTLQQHQQQRPSPPSRSLTSTPGDSSMNMDTL